MSCLVDEVRPTTEAEAESITEVALLVAADDASPSSLSERRSSAGLAPCEYAREDEYGQLIETADVATSAWLVRRVLQIDALRLNLRSVVPGRLSELRNERVFVSNELAAIRDDMNEEMLQARASSANPVRVRAWSDQVDAALEELSELEIALQEIDSELGRISESRRDVIAEVARRLASGSPGAADYAPIFRRIGE